MKILIDFINENIDWEEKLVNEPYYVITKWSEDKKFFLLKYSLLISDFSNPIVQRCRGSIFTWDSEKNKCKCVCAPFFSFRNYGEECAADIDWNSASVQEKVDGSLIKVWNYEGEWHVSTNGTINAYNATINDLDMSFGDVFDMAFDKVFKTKEDLFRRLSPEYTYMFELVSPLTRCTIDYKEPKLYYLGQRNINTFEESYEYNDAFSIFNIWPVHFYSLRTMDECIAAVNAMSKDQEGFVVCDKNWNRIKVKSPEYLLAARAQNNGVITVRRVLETYKRGNLDDFLAYAPNYRDFVNDVMNAYHEYKEELSSYDYLLNCSMNVGKKEFALAIKDNPNKDYLFMRRNGQVKNLEEYMDRMRLCTLVDIVKERMKH